MKILMLGLFDPCKNDACKIHFMELANALLSLDHDVEVIIPRGPVNDVIISPNIRIHSLPFFYSEQLMLVVFLSFVQLFKYGSIVNRSFDIVYIRWRALPACFIRTVNWIKSVSPKILTEHNGWVEFEVRLQRNSKVLSWIAKLLQILDARYSNRVIAVTEGIKKLLIKNHVPAKKIKVVGNGTNLLHFYPIPDNQKLKTILVGIEGIVLGFIGNVSKWQELDELIEAFSQLKKYKNDLFLLLIGSGIHLNSIQRKVRRLNLEQSVIYKNDISYQDMNRWINIMDITFAPKSKFLDTVGYSPLKIRDYAACGKPVVSTLVNGIKQFEPHGWLKTYDPDLKNELFRIVFQLLKNKKILVEMGKKARKYAEDNFSWSKIANEILTT